MADSPRYVNVAKFAVKSMFDTKYKAKVTETMRKTVIRVLEKSKKLTPKEPRGKEEKGREGFYLDGSVVKLVKGEVKGKTLIATEVKIIIATWPKKKMLAFSSGKGKLDSGNPDKIQGDVLFLVETVVKDVMEKDVIKDLERRSKQLKD